MGGSPRGQSASEKSVKYAKQVTTPFATDYPYLAAASAMAGDMAGAKVAAAQVVRLDPNWSVEKYLSDGGGYPDDAAMMFIEAARKAGVTACVPADRLSSMPSRRAMRRGFTKQLARRGLHAKARRLTFANVRLWH